MNRERIDQLWPPSGPCAFCGGPDKRHRIFDVIRARHEAGESLEELAADYETTVEHILAALAWAPEVTAEAIEAHALEALIQEWLSDPEAMPEERREALLDVVREVMDRNVSGVSFAHGVTMVTRGFGFLDLNTKPRRTYDREAVLDEVESFGLTAADARVLCEEAGLPS